MDAWIARDSDGNLFIYNEKPEKGSYCCWWCRSNFLPIKEEDLPQGVNPSWEDEEPIEVEITINKVNK